MGFIWREKSDRVGAGFAGADADGAFDIGDEDLAVADASGLGGLADGLDGALDGAIGQNQFYFDLGQEIDDIFRATVKLGMALLAAKTLRLGNGDAMQPRFLKRFLHLVEFEGFDDGFDFFHSWAILPVMRGGQGVKPAACLPRATLAS